MTQATASDSPLKSGTVHPLVERITRMRGRVRAVVGLFGASAVTVSAVGGMVVLMVGDYLLHFAGPTRLVLLLTGLVALAVLTWRVLINPLSTRLTDQFLASRVENIHKELSDELISAVHFIHAGTIKTNAMAAQHVDAAAKKTASIRFEEAVDFRRSTKAAGLAVLIVVLAGVVFAFNPALGWIGLSRWFSASPMDWPRINRVVFEWGTANGQPPAVIPIGEQFVVRAKVVQGGYAGQYVKLRYWLDNKSNPWELMTYQPAMSSKHEFVYERSLEPDGERLMSVKVEAGDDTEQSPVDIRLAARPMITEMNAAITPPGYVRDVKDPTKAAPAVQVNLMSQAGRAVEGATVALRVRASKPFLKDASVQPEVWLLDQVKDEKLPLALTRRLVEENVAEVTFAATKTLQARLSMRDTDGFENRAGGTLSMEVVPDGMPSVVITEPRRLVERSPTALVNVAVQATDDLGLDGIKLVVERFDAKPGETPLLEAPLTWAERTVDPAAGNTTGRARYAWDLAPLKLLPGARLSFYAMVQDNYEVNGKRHDWVKSAPLTLQILSDLDIERIARTALNDVKDRMKSLKREQEQTRDATDVIKNAAAQSGVTTAQQKEQLAQLAQQQAQEAATANSIQQKVEQIKNDLQQNKMAESDLGKLAAEVSEGMKDVGQNNMPKAASALNQAQQSAGNHDPKDGGKQDEQAKAQAKQTADSTKVASNQQGEAIAKMDNMIGKLGAVSDMAAAINDLQRIQKEQERLTDETRKMAPDVIGKKPEELPEDLRKRLEKAAGDQKELGKQTTDLIKQMQEASQAMQPSNPAAAESLSKAAAAGKQSNVPGSQGKAGEEMQKGQMSSASGKQGEAKSGLDQMMEELKKNEKRELEQLQRQLAELIEQVKDLRKAEDALNKDTETAGAKATAAALVKLGDRQGKLQMNTILVQKKAESTKDAQKAAVDIRDAGEQMSLAAGALYGNKQTASLDPEATAIAFLDAAIDKLQKQKDKIDEELKKNDLAQFIKEYTAIRTAQQKIKDSSDQIDARREAAADKQVDRLGLRDLAGLVTTQNGLIEQINKLSTDEKLKEYAVIVWMNTKITEAMGVSKEDMSKAQTGRRLAMAQKTAIDRITDIINALKEEKDKSDFKKDEQNGGGGGGGKKPLIPPIAQLKLLKAMQGIVNMDTVSVNKAIETAPSDAAKDELLEEAKKIGKTQGEIRDVVDKVIEEMKK